MADLGVKEAFNSRSDRHPLTPNLRVADAEAARSLNWQVFATGAARDPPGRAVAPPTSGVADGVSKAAYPRVPPPPPLQDYLHHYKASAYWCHVIGAFN